MQQATSRPTPATTRGRATTLLLAFLLTLFVALPAVPAQAATRAIVGPSPVPGSVLEAGPLAVGAFISSSNGIQDARIRLDGVDVATQRTTDDPAYQHVTAAVDATPGTHVVGVTIVEPDGFEHTRLWRFTVSGVNRARIAGDSRTATAIAISRTSFPSDSGADSAMLARDDDFADALSGAPLGAATNGPLLLTGRTSLHPDVAAELTRVVAPGADVYLLGGPGALSAQVADEVAALGFSPVRLSGPDRFATAVAAAQALPTPATVIITNAWSFPDALSASSPAARDGAPILLTSPDTLPGATRAYLTDLAPSRITIVGGTSVVSDAVQAELETLSRDVVRIAGASRYDTSAAVAQHFFPFETPVTIASGERFPDALAGGAHAARIGGPLLLTPGATLHPSVAVRIETYAPSTIIVLGGTGAVSAQAEDDARLAAVSTGAPRTTRIEPGPGSTINNIDGLEISFDAELDIPSASVFVTVAGQEVAGQIVQGDFADTLVFRANDIPFRPAADTPYPVHVTVQVTADGASWRHLDYDLTFVKLDLGRGDNGASVLAVQQRLQELGYWLGTADGNYGGLTSQAVMALQKANGLKRTGSLDAATREVLETRGRPIPRTKKGYRIEIDKTRQIMMFVRDGYVEYTMNTSTGTETYYTFEGERKFAHTPEGNFKIIRQIDGMREAPLGKLWRPKYFTNTGIALHGSTSVPAYAASHGCTRLTYAAIDFVWESGIAPIGTEVFVYQ